MFFMNWTPGSSKQIVEDDLRELYFSLLAIPPLVRNINTLNKIGMTS